MNKHSLSLSILALALTVPVLAKAELIDNRKKPALPTAVERSRAVTMGGNSDESNPMENVKFGYMPVFTREVDEYLHGSVKGFGNGVGVGFAVRQILPEYEVVVEVDDQIPVSWSGGMSRLEVLNSMKVDNQDVALVVYALERKVFITERFKVQRLLDRPVNREWTVLVSDAKLSTSLKRWAKEAGYTFKWDADRHVLVGATTSFFGSFEDVLGRVLNTPGIKNSEYPLEACIYANTPPLVRITRLGDQNDCQ